VIDLTHELARVVADEPPSSGSVARARAAGRQRRNRKRAGLAASAVGLVVVVLAGTWLVWSRGPASTTDGLVTGPGVGADAPTSLTVTCTADGPVLSSTVVQAGPDGVAVEYRNAVGDATGFSIGAGDGTGRASGGALASDQVLTRVEAVPPGPATVKCISPASNIREASGTSVTIVDPNQLYRPAELDCDGGGQVVVDFDGTADPVGAPEDALADLLDDAALADHDVEAAGYPGVVPRPFVVRQGGRTVALPGFVVVDDDHDGNPEGYRLVELTACADALRHG
jgi:hypothetical protein